ncbi:MAG: hypothetical protein KatS3mg060_3525 [Dehalococcoidia bacterium]|nr:MAG: hypothetical protein KatS3mg060_3525 [Dehalococcoidia bacterium]
MTSRAEPAIHADASDLELLRRFEPIVKYTRGEEFLPTRVDDYVAACSLWIERADGREELLVPRGQVTVETLGQPWKVEPGERLYLKFIEPLTIAELTRERLKAGGPSLREPDNLFRPDVSRLARVGYLSRIADALFSLTLLLRGRVPGDAAAAAVLEGRRLRSRDDRCSYYGRVVRQGDWIALQYWFFYYFNDWRSGFFGANDHEADWEMITVFCYATVDGEVRPAWAAYASHDYHGDDLRRRWDDSDQLEVIDGHPVVYAGAGSHASYFRPGEYLTEVPITLFQPLVRVARAIGAFWVRTLRQSDSLPLLSEISIPFVDYARGDGLAVGYGQERAWHPIVLDPGPAWVSQYRGLFGVYVRDPLGGENAPSGPKFNRDGTVRHAWYDPVGWAGLDSTPTPTRALDLAEQTITTLEARQAELAAAILSKHHEVEALGTQIAGIRNQAHLADRLRRENERLRALRHDLAGLRQEQAENEGMLAALRRRRDRLAAGELDPPRAHLHRLATPASPASLRVNRLVELWAAASIGLFVVVLLLIIAFAREWWLLGFAGLLTAFVLIEALLRRQLTRLVTSFTVILAVIAGLYLIYRFFWEIAFAGTLLAALFLLWENIRELRR